MLREIEGIAAEPSTRRRWFHDDYFDLFVWQTEKGEVILFQLCYGTAESGQALVWHREVGLFHDGDKLDNEVAGQVVQRFEKDAEHLPRRVRSTVSERIREHLEGRLPAANRRKRFRRESWQQQAG
jgi:hypothetical protein